MLGLVLNSGAGSSAKWLPGDSRRVGVTGPGGDTGAGVAGRMGRGLRGNGVKRPPNRPLVEGGVGKICVCAGVRRQLALITGPRILWIRSWQINVSRFLAFAMSTNSTGHFNGERTTVASSDCLCAETNRMYPAGIWITVDM